MTDAFDAAAMVNEMQSGWARFMGVTFTKATIDEVVAEWTVGPEHRQPYGIVHGGVHCGVVETVASVGAALVAAGRGQHVVGLENTTSFVHAVREGRLRATGKPLTRGRRTQVWEVRIDDEGGRLVAKGSVRVLCIEADADLAGRRVDVDPLPR